MTDVFDTLTIKKKDIFDTIEPAERDVFDEVGEPIGVAESIKRAGVLGFAKKLPFSPYGVAEQADLLGAKKRLGAGEYEKYQKLPKYQMTPMGGYTRTYQDVFTRERDTKVLEDYFANLEEESRRGKTFWAKVASGVSVLPVWMLEFAATGGLAQIGKKSIQKFAEKLIKKQTAAKMAGWLGGAAARTVAMPHRVGEAVAKRQVQEPEGWATAAAKGWGEVFIEAASETAGETITKGLGIVAKKLPFGGKLLNGLHKAWKKIRPTKATADFMRQISTKVGYSNLIGEIGEERLATIMHSIAKTDDFGAGKDSSIVQRLKAGIAQDIENLPVEAVVLAAPGAARYALAKVMDGGKAPAGAKILPETLTKTEQGPRIVSKPTSLDKVPPTAPEAIVKQPEGKVEKKIERVTKKLKEGKYKGKIQAADYANVGIRRFLVEKMANDLRIPEIDLKELIPIKITEQQGWDLPTEPTIDEFKAAIPRIKQYSDLQNKKGQASKRGDYETAVKYEKQMDDLLAEVPTPPAAKEHIDTAKFERQARIEEAMTKGEMGQIEIEPGFHSTSKSVNEHIDYFENIQIPETSKIRPIQREIRRINGLRLAGKITAPEANKRVRALRTELFKTAKGEGVSLRVTKGGKLSLALRKAGTYVPAEFSKYPKFKNIAPLFGGGQDITRAVQQMDGALTVKQKVKTKGQAGPIEKHVLWRTRDISKQRIDFIKEQTIRLRKILKVRPNSKDDTLVNNVLREIKSGQGLKEALKNPEVRKISTNPKIIHQAVQLREWYDDMINDQNALREMRNQDPIPYRRNYSPEILRDATIWERVMMKDTEPKQVIHGVELPDYVKPNKPFNPRELARDAGIKYEERVKSATQLARNYLITASKDIFNTSIIQNNKAFIQQLETMGLEKSAQYLGDWTAEAYAGVKPKLNRALPVPKRVEKEARRFNRARNIAVFPLNFSWNLTTQPSSLAFTFQKYGAWNTMRGFLDWMNPKIRKQVAKDYYSYIVKSSKHGRVTRQDVQNLIGETTAIRKTAGENLYDMTSIMIHEMEKLLTGVSIRAAHHHGKARGLKGKALQEFSSDGGGKTQSMYNDEDRPAILRSLAAKTLTPYQTFNFEAVNNLREWAGRTGTPPSSQAERAMQLVRFVIAAGIFRMIAKKVANKSIWSWERIPIPLAEYWLSPIIKIWNKEYTGTPSLPSPVAVMARVIKGIRDVYDTGSWRGLRRELITYGTGYLGIPGGVQINRVVEGLIAYSKGGVFDRRGRIMFKVDPDEWNEAILFGVYATRGGRKYLDKLKGKEEKEPRRLDIAERQALRKMAGK